jgi:anti-sigma factor RsiW
MNCQTCQSQLSAYLDAELTGEQMIKVRRHLQECPTCAEEAESVKTLLSALGSMKMEQPPAGFEQRLMASLPADRKPIKVKRIAVFGLAAASSLAAAAAATAFFLMSTSVDEPTASAKPVPPRINDQPYAGDPFGHATVFSASRPVR